MDCHWKLYSTLKGHCGARWWCSRLNCEHYGATDPRSRCQVPPEGAKCVTLQCTGPRYKPGPHHIEGSFNIMVSFTLSLCLSVPMAQFKVNEHQDVDTEVVRQYSDMQRSYRRAGVHCYSFLKDHHHRETTTSKNGGIKKTLRTNSQVSKRLRNSSFWNNLIKSLR